MNCDRIARHYRLFELAAFGTRLERHRFLFLNRVTDVRRALILGEGDGRFLTRFLVANPHVQIDCVDLSARMLQLARSRIASSSAAARVRFIHADARQLHLESAAYDLVITNFFLDCFEAAEIDALVRAIVSACQPRAHWLITDFHQPASGWRARHAALWLAAMYAFFRIATGLRVARLADYRLPLQRAGFQQIASHRSFGDLVTSELWLRSL
jgi:ubiquinone/menaquinone biosynthesis C-methylase UbiE